MVASRDRGVDAIATERRPVTKHQLAAWRDARAAPQGAGGAMNAYPHAITKAERRSLCQQSSSNSKTLPLKRSTRGLGEPLSALG
jgi:hypothetical protein